MSKRRFRLYLDFASGGTIGKAMQMYDHRWEKVKRHKTYDKIERTKHLPEAFIWHTIKALAISTLALESGTLNDEPIADWRPIMHLDFQTPNVLLDVQGKKRKLSNNDVPNPAHVGPSKKAKIADGTAGQTIIPKLADFGLSTFDLDFTHPSLDENPEAHILPLLSPTQQGRAPCPATRYAPKHIHFNPTDPVRLDAKTDVWSLGRIAWALIVNMWEDDGPLREGGVIDELTGETLALSKNVPYNRSLNDRYDQQVLVGTDWPAARKYSEELKDLVRDCLRFDKEMRASLRQVLDRAEKWLRENGEEALGAMNVEKMIADKELLVLPDRDGLEVGGRLKVRTSRLNDA